MCFRVFRSSFFFLWTWWTYCLSANLRAVDQELHTFLDGKLLVSQKRRLVEILDILGRKLSQFIRWCCAQRTLINGQTSQNTNNLLIIQTAHPDLAWLEYDLAFRRDAAAAGSTDWGRMNLDFHLRSPARPLDKLVVGSAFTSTSTSRGYGSPTPHCTSWNNGLCHWPFGECRFRHVCSSCDGAHPKVSCPFCNPSPVAPSPAKRGRL